MDRTDVYFKPEYDAINRRLARKITIAANFFYFFLGFILWFFIQTSPTFAIDHLPLKNLAMNVCTPGSPKDNPFENITVEGYITEKPTAIPLNNGKIVAIDSLTHQRLDSAYSDISGYFTFDFVTALNEIKNHGLEDKLYPTPYTTQANIEVNTASAGNYVASVEGTDGRLVFTKDIDLENGYNSLNITGGKNGQYIVNIRNGKESHSFKTIVTNTDEQFNITNSDKEKTETNLKSTNATNYVIFEYSKPGHTTIRRTEQVTPTMNLGNQDLWMTPTFSINTTIKPYDVNGNPANITLTIHWPNVSGADSIKTYTPNANNEIIIHKDLYTANANATLELDTVNYVNNQKFLNILMGRVIHQPIQDSNIYQSPKEWNQPAQPVVVNMNNPKINDQTIYNYVIPLKVPDPTGAPGDSIRMDSPVVTQMMTSRPGAGFMTHRYIPTPDPAFQPFYKFRLTYNKTDNTPMSTTQINRQKTLSEMTDNMSPIPNTGDQIFVDQVDFPVNSPTNTTYVQRTSNPNADLKDQFIQIFYFNSTPQSSVWYKNTHTPNGELRASFGDAGNTSTNSDGIVFAEYYKVKTTTSDPQGTSSSPYIWSSTLNGPTLLAYTMARAQALSNLNFKY